MDGNAFSASFSHSVFFIGRFTFVFFLSSYLFLYSSLPLPLSPSPLLLTVFPNMCSTPQPFLISTSALLFNPICLFFLSPHLLSSLSLLLSSSLFPFLPSQLISPHLSPSLSPFLPFTRSSPPLQPSAMSSSTRERRPCCTVVEHCAITMEVLISHIC